MPILTIRHVTTYHYRRPVAFGEHRMMLRPRDDGGQTVLRSGIAITPEPACIDWTHDDFKKTDGTTRIRGAGELRHKESDRIAGIAAGLVSLGARVDVDGDDLAIHGRAALRGAPTDSLDDHRLAMTFAIAGLVASGETVVGRPGSAAISYPAFFADLERVRA